MKKTGFTLIELLVVISIVSMLVSTVLASVNNTRAQGRDSLRTQQVRQLDLAVRLYTEDKKHVPDLGGTCAAQTTAPYTDPSSACFVISTSGTQYNYSDGPKTPWQKFTEDLQPYISSLPQDPCPSCTPSRSSYPLGYTYISPLSLQYTCAQSNCTRTAEDFNQSYQLYAPLEKKQHPLELTK